MAADQPLIRQIERQQINNWQIERLNLGEWHVTKALHMVAADRAVANPTATDPTETDRALADRTAERRGVAINKSTTHG